MDNDASGELQELIDRIRRGDRGARRQLLERACGRLRRLAARLLHGSFPAVQARHELDSVVHEAWLRLVPALDKANPPTVADFFRLAAHKIRQVLLDMVERQRRLAGREILGADNGSSTGPPADRPDNTYDPARLAQWTEFHEQAAALPDDERTVFELHYYLDLPQAEIARLLDLHPRKVSYLWVAATERLAEGLGEAEGVV
ncbi:MAG TPA: sigma-70 family RNA polymerase sigma factor [Gemmataceae bacterium]|nr:sigma-70 family RNA polymerase sigma factor [Gemmataceae bacterium]